MYSDSSLILELVWEYNYTPEQARNIVDSYIENNQYDLLLQKLAFKQAKRITAYMEGEKHVQSDVPWADVV